MLYDAVNGTIAVDDTEIDYFAFGNGRRAIVMLPGVSEGLMPISGLAMPVALLYRQFAAKFRVFVFGRRHSLPHGFTTRDMARDIKRCMDALGIRRANVVGVSEGGMIAQHLAIDYPQAVRRLVLAVTASRPNPTLCETLQYWRQLAEKGDFDELMRDNARRSYSEGYLQKHRLLMPMLSLIPKPQDYSRFIVQCNACLRHDIYARLAEIRCPTLLLAGGADKVLGAQASREIAAAMPAAQLHIYPRLSHAAYAEAQDFNVRIKAFLIKG